MRLWQGRAFRNTFNCATEWLNDETRAATQAPGFCQEVSAAAGRTRRQAPRAGPGLPAMPARLGRLSLGGPAGFDGLAIQAHILDTPAHFGPTHNAVAQTANPYTGLTYARNPGAGMVTGAMVFKK